MRVFIDGENLRHRLSSILYQAHKLSDYDQSFQFNVRRFVEDMVGQTDLEILYYTTRIHQPTFDVPEHLLERLQHIQASHRRWIAMLTNQGITVVKAGNLKVHENAACYHCGRHTLVLQEKGVDVRLASEMVMAAVHDDQKEFVMLSSDADMIPAIDIARRSGCKVIYGCFEEEVNEALQIVTDDSFHYTRSMVEANFMKVDKNHG